MKKLEKMSKLIYEHRVKRFGARVQKAPRNGMPIVKESTERRKQWCKGYIEI